MKLRCLSIVLFALGVVTGRADAADGRALYAQRCAFCHGPEGKGDGPSAQALQPPPRDFTTASYWQAVGVARVREIIENGKPGTAMIGFKNLLKPEEVTAVLDHVQSFRPTQK